MKFKTFFLKVEYEGELRIFESNLFHSTNADEKKKKKRIKEKVIPYCNLLFSMNWFSKKLNEINILGTVIYQFCKGRKVFKIIFYFEENLMPALDKASQ